MNKNLNWTDNRVLSTPSAVSPVTMGPTSTPSAKPQQEAPQPLPPATGVSPAQYNAPPTMPNATGVSPMQYQNAPGSGVSPATYPGMDNSFVSPAGYKNMMGGTPAPMGTPWQDTGTPSYSGLSPAQSAPQSMMPSVMPSVGMQAIPTEPMGNDTRGAITRDSTYAPSPITGEPGPPSVMDPGYIPAYLRTQIGKRVRAEFIFTNQYLDKTGILKYVGYNYFVLEDTATHAMVMCDLYSARFITSA